MLSHGGQWDQGCLLCEMGMWEWLAEHDGQAVQDCADRFWYGWGVPVSKRPQQESPSSFWPVRSQAQINNPGIGYFPRCLLVVSKTRVLTLAWTCWEACAHQQQYGLVLIINHLSPAWFKCLIMVWLQLPAMFFMKFLWFFIVDFETALDWSRLVASLRRVLQLSLTDSRPVWLDSKASHIHTQYFAFSVSSPSPDMFIPKTLAEPLNAEISEVGTKIFWSPEFFDRDYGHKVGDQRKSGRWPKETHCSHGRWMCGPWVSSCTAW